MNCSLCEGNSSSSIATTDCKSGKDLNIVICDNCGLIQQHPIPSTAELNQYYATEYRVDYKGVHEPKSKHIYRAARLAVRRYEYLRSYGIDSGDLLDVGAGGGEFVAICDRMGFQAKGVEPNVGYSRYARSQYNVDILTTELDDVCESYDVITMFHVMEHLRMPGEVFEKLHSILRPGGHLLIEVPWGLSSSISPRNRYFKAHLYYFDVETLASFASSHFEIISTRVDGNLSLLLRRKEIPSSRALPSRDYAGASRSEASAFGWWTYLTDGGAYRVPSRKIRNLIAEAKVNGQSGQSIIGRAVNNLTPASPR